MTRIAFIGLGEMGLKNWPTAAGWIDGYRPGSSLDILVKDAGLALDLAREEGVPAPILGLASQMIVALTRQFGGAPAS